MRWRLWPPWPDLLTVLEMSREDVVAVSRSHGRWLARMDERSTGRRWRALGRNIRKRRWIAVGVGLLRPLAKAAVASATIWMVWYMAGRSDESILASVPYLVLLGGVINLYVAASVQAMNSERCMYFTAAARGKRYGRGDQRVGRMRAASHAVHAAKVQKRWRFWWRDVSTRPDPWAHKIATVPFASALPPMAISMSLVGLVQIKGGSMLIPMGASTTLFLLTMLAWALTPAVAPRALRSFVSKRVRAGRCGNCGYSVGGLPDQDPKGIMRGPARCPECACRWPLVLPPAPPRGVAFRT